jgi:hypothetical protein
MRSRDRGGAMFPRICAELMAGTGFRLPGLVSTNWTNCYRFTTKRPTPRRRCLTSWRTSPQADHEGIPVNFHEPGISWIFAVRAMGCDGDHCETRLDLSDFASVGRWRPRLCDSSPHRSRSVPLARALTGINRRLSRICQVSSAGTPITRSRARFKSDRARAISGPKPNHMPSKT